MERNKNDWNTNTFTGEIENENGALKRAVKKFFKKQVDWYIYPWATRQNEVNGVMKDSINQIENALEIHNKNLNDLETIFNQKVDTALSKCAEDIRMHEEIMNNQYDLIKTLNEEKQQLTDKINLLETYNGQYKNNCNTDISFHCDDINKKIADAENMEDNEEQIREIAKQYDAMIREEYSPKSRETIVIICIDLEDGRTYEAIRKETFYIYNQLKKESRFDSILVSMKLNGNDIVYDNDIIYVGENKMIEFLQTINVKLVLWNCPVINYAHCAQDVFLKYLTVVRTTSQSPLQMSDSDIEGFGLTTLLHLNDYGFLYFFTLSSYAKDKLENVGFKNVKLSVPQIDITKYSRREDLKSLNTIGFASSPMQNSDNDERGIGLLEDVIKENPQFQFKILWRNQSVEVSEKLKNCTNAEIIYGLYDMEKFYHEIDCLMIPYKSYYNNHACSMSSIEAMLYGVPVISTQKAGVSEWVSKAGMGLVVEENCDSVTKGLEDIKNCYSIFTNINSYNHYLNLLSEDNLVFSIEQIAGKYRPDNIVTLGEWQKALQDNGRDLVMGRENIKAYYSQFSVAEHYTEQRFTSIYDKCLDMFERLSIDYIIEQKKKKGEISLLDIAPGDGRILQEDIKFGKCVAMDASAAMLNLVTERFSGMNNLTTVEGDYFVDNIEGEFDVITTFRYLRHFAYRERKLLYSKIKSNLKQDGILIFDVPNIKFELEQRKVKGWQNYNIYDVFWTKEAIVNELQENGFRVDKIIEVGNGLTQNSNEPMTWTVSAINN